MHALASGMVWDSWRRRKVHFGWESVGWKFLKYSVIYGAIELYFLLLHQYHQQWSDFMLNIKPEFRETGFAPVYYYAIITALT